MPVTDARKELADLVNRVAYSGDRIALTRRGRVMAALVPMKLAENAQHLEERNRYLEERVEHLERVLAERLDLTEIGPVASEPGQQAARVDPLRIAAEYRPGRPPGRPGFSR